MPEPMYSETTERVYERLPQVYRREDALQDWQMKKYLASVLEIQDVVSVLIDRFTYTPPDDGVSADTSDLVDPMTADEAWLPWLGQLVGVRINKALTVAQQRDAIRTALSGTQAGTKTSIANAAKTALTGSQTVYVHSFSDDGGIGAGGQWDILLLTLSEETVGDPVAAVIAAGAKPAGVKLWHLLYGASWDTIEASYSTWADWDAETWNDIEQTGS
jgi:hypothetical protein